MRTFAVPSFALLLTLSASAATLKVEVNRNGFTGPIEIAVAPRVEGRPPEWSAAKTLAAGKSVVTFPHLAEGLYLVLASGQQPLQRLSAKANLGAAGSTLRLVVPKTQTALSVTLADEPLARAGISLTHDELRWRMDVETDEDGHFAGPFWEPGVYSAGVTRDRSSAPHFVDVRLSSTPLTINVPDRHVTGRVLTGEGKPLADAQVTLRSETTVSTLTTRTKSAPDGHFEFFGVREGAHTLAARAPSWLDSDAARFELRGSTRHSADLVLARGEPRTVRVVDASDAAIAGATLLTSCDGHVKSTAVTNAEGRADVAVPAAASCTIYVLPKEGSIAAGRFEGPQQLLIRVPDGSSSLHLALKSEAGAAFPDLRLLMRIDGTVVPPEIARLLANRGFPLMTDGEGSIALARIPPGTYEFWPYRTASEGQMIYEVSAEIAAPISVKVLTGENSATIRFKAR
ncbi:MAG TPA: carboxypeptidase-like regulatory domain-containing protein [Thermoanaerobaculia bacterium]|nr:carboxypeptidase-like regulatory domain-containing protein [Thermoanaerobaculia bacterium]